jgi:hypothetical protein
MKNEFQQITSLWTDSDLLYVADSINASIKIFRILPPCS